MHRLAAWYLDYKPPTEAAAGPRLADPQAIADVTGMMAERPLDDTQRATLATLKAKGLA